MKNQLAGETSPYLLQHAHNPVAWQPWGEAAFEEARRRNVPVFLSIGYSTCYWCHVMERESFEDAATAAVLNEHFVAIKVDREERPDVDEVYMAATVIMTGHGGWPMSVFLEPVQRRPFWCGTYFPKTGRGNMPSFTQVLESIARAYREERAAVDQQAEELAAAVREQTGGAPTSAALGQSQVTNAVAALLRIFDRTNGGFGPAPKFPQPAFLEFLMDARDRAGDDATREAIDTAVRITLDAIAKGGIHDHIGGGFHRYSVDATWTVPHFEKMLYDNAQLAGCYARAARRSGDSTRAAWWAWVARRTLAYVTREMTGPEGGFYSAQDAEVDGREGLNYLWTPEQVRASLDDHDAPRALVIYGLHHPPNFRDPHHPESIGHVLRLDQLPLPEGGGPGVGSSGLPARPAAEKSQDLPGVFSAAPSQISPNQPTPYPLPQGGGSNAQRLEAINAALYTARQQRKQPCLDDKVIASWNGLMIGAFAAAARELEDKALLAPARQAAAFVLKHMTTGKGHERQLLRSWRAGQARIAGFLEDYAFIIHGLLELSRATDGAERQQHLTAAKELLVLAEAAFFDPASGAWFDTHYGGDGAADVFVRTRATHDGAIPSAVSVMLHNLLDLAELTDDMAYRAQALRSLVAISSAVAESPVGCINSTRALLRLLVAEPAAAAALDATPPAAATGPRSIKAADAAQPVEVYSSVDRVTLKPGVPAALTLFVKIADGFHIAAAAQPAGAPPLTPFRISIVNGGGVAAYADYPVGAVIADGLHAYTGSFEVEVALERTGEWKGQPLLSVRFQACTETECLAVGVVELDIAIDL